MSPAGDLSTLGLKMMGGVDTGRAPSTRTPLPMLYQSGYLTIKSRDPFTGAYTLGIPNAEVARDMSRAL